MKKYLITVIFAIMFLCLLASVAKADSTDWTSVNEFETFWAEHKAEFKIYGQPGRDGIIQLDGQCAGWAIGLRELGKKYDKDIEVQFIPPNEYYRVFGEWLDYYHFINLIIVGSDVYFVEPQNMKVRISGYIP